MKHLKSHPKVCIVIPICTINLTETANLKFLEDDQLAIMTTDPSALSSSSASQNGYKINFLSCNSDLEKH